jgi:hypothetical protein
MEMDEVLRKVREDDAAEDALETPGQTPCRRCRYVMRSIKAYHSKPGNRSDLLGILVDDVIRILMNLPQVRMLTTCSTIANADYATFCGACHSPCP